MPLSRHAPAKSVQRHNILYSLRQDILYTFKVKQTPREEAFVAWKVRDVVSQRIELVVRVINGGESIAKLSQEYGISRATAHTWLKRYRQENSFTALQDRSRAPHQVRNRTSRQVEQQVLELRAAEPLERAQDSGGIAAARDPDWSADNRPHFATQRLHRRRGSTTTRAEAIRTGTAQPVVANGL